MTLDPAIVRDLGLELDVEAQQMAARVLRLARIETRLRDLAERSGETVKRIPPAVER